MDIHIPFAALAAVSGISSSGLLVVGLVKHEGPGSSVWVVVVWMALIGMAATAIQGFFYKIATFLVWLKRYAPVAGRERVPRLEELYNRRLALTGFAMWSASILGGAIVLVGNQDILRPVGAAMLAGLTCFLINVAMIARHWIGGIRPRVLRVATRHEPAH